MEETTPQDVINNEVNSEVTDEQIRLMEIKIKLYQRFTRGINWFYAIAGLSILNTIVYLVGENWNFIVGLGITQFIDALFINGYGTGTYVALGIDVIIAGSFALLGFSGKKKEANWVFIVGIIAYGLDALLLILVKDWLGIVFHVFALYGFYNAMKANKLLKQLNSFE